MKNKEKERRNKEWSKEDSGEGNKGRRKKGD